MLFPLMHRLLALALLACTTALPAAGHIDDPGKLLPADSAWAKGVNTRLDAFEGTAGIKILVQYHLKSPAAEEDKVPGAYMSALSRQLGTLPHGGLLVYFADDPDWRVWIGDELASTFAGQPGTVQELTLSGAIHDVKEAMLAAAQTKAEAAATGKAPAEKLAGQTDALLDALMVRLAPK
jgi:hypothetical protein